MERITLSQKIEIYPNKEQIEELRKYFGYRRYCYNRAIRVQKEMYKEWRDFKNGLTEAELKRKVVKKVLMEKYPSFYSLRKRINTELKDWESLYNNRIRQYAAADVTDAIKNALNPKMPNHKFPKYKKKKNEKQSISVPIKVVDKKCFVPRPKNKEAKLIGWIRMSEGIRWEGDRADISTISYSHGKWYLSVTIKLNEDETKKERDRYKFKFGERTGVDVNIRHFDYKNSFNEYMQVPTLNKRMEQLHKQISYYQRMLSKKKEKNKLWKTSKSYQRTKTKLDRAYRRLLGQQEELINQFVHYLHNQYKEVVIEDLDVTSMKMNKRLCRSLHKAMFGRFKIKMATKVQSSELKLYLADQFYPSTQRCSCCGMVKTGEDKLGLSGDRHGNGHNEYKCYHCGEEMNRDENAVDNLIQYPESSYYKNLK